MSHSSYEKNGTTVITLSGKIMGGPEAGQINDQIHALIDQGKKKIIIDLHEVEWMNSSGLGILIGAMTTLKNNGGTLSLTNVSDRIMNLLKITKLKNVFSIHSDVDTAINEM
jgi:anti-sigma B factor antagonist